MADEERNDSSSESSTSNTGSAHTDEAGGDARPAKKATSRRRTSTRKTAAGTEGDSSTGEGDTGPAAGEDSPAPARRSRSRSTKASPDGEASGDAAAPALAAEAKPARRRTRSQGDTAEPPTPAAAALVFQPPEPPAEPPKRRRTRSTAAQGEGQPEGDSASDSASDSANDSAQGSAEKAPEKAARKRPAKKVTAQPAEGASKGDAGGESRGDGDADSSEDSEQDAGGGQRSSSSRRRRRGRRGGGRSRSGGDSQRSEDDSDSDADSDADSDSDSDSDSDTDTDTDSGDSGDETSADSGAKGQRPKGSGQKTGQKKSGQKASTSSDDAGDTDDADSSDDSDDSDDEESGSSTRRRRRRRRGRGGGGGGGGGNNGGGGSGKSDSGDDTGRRDVDPDDEIKGIKGSTRMEAKRQRRREGRETSRRRQPIISEAEFLARRESVDRVMVVRQGADRTQVAVLEDDVLVEHYITRSEHTSYVGNVYLGRVQNVLPSMEAAFVDIAKGRNGVLYAGEVNYDASQLDGRPPRIEQALKSGQSVLVQVTKDPIAHKGARLTSQISIPGRYLVFVPDGRSTGISRKLPDKERTRLKNILKRLTPEGAGLIVRTAAEGASEEQLERDVARMQAQWEDIKKKAETGNAPSLVYGEPDLVIRVIRDIFNEDFVSLVVQGEDEWDTVESYIAHVAPDLKDRLSKWSGEGDAFAHYRIDEQLAKALDRKVWLPSGGSLVIDRTEAMTVVDVNTGKFTGSGGNLEETVTRNNLEAAEEIVRQLRLRDIGGIIVIDFIDMVLESNRELVLRRLVECLGRDRTKHQVAEVTSLGLVQMTRKRIGQGLLDAFSQTCSECNGRGVQVVVDPFEPPSTENKGSGGSGSGGSGSGRGSGGGRSSRSSGGRRGKSASGSSSGGSSDGSGDGSAGSSADGASDGSERQRSEENAPAASSS